MARVGLPDRAVPGASAVPAVPVDPVDLAGADTAVEGAAATDACR